MNNEKYVGMDVHKATCVIVIKNAVGQVLMRTLLATEAQILRDFLQGLRGSVHLAFEEGTQSAWLYALLKPLVKTVIVSNARHNQTLGGGNKTDFGDAEQLAEWLRLGALKPVYKGTAAQQQLKDLAQTYQNLVSDCIRVMNRLKALYRARGIKCDGRAIYQVSQREAWLAKFDEAGARFRAQSLFEQLAHLQTLRHAAKAEWLCLSKQQADYAVLLSQPGLGAVRVGLLLAYVGAPQRFRTKRQFWPYCGLAVVLRGSGEYKIVKGAFQRRHQALSTRGLNRNHVPALKSVFKDAALSAQQREPFKSWCQQRLDAGQRPELVRVSLARKLAATTLICWQRREKFDASKVSATI